MKRGLHQLQIRSLAYELPKKRGVPGADQYQHPSIRGLGQTCDIREDLEIALVPVGDDVRPDRVA